MSYIAEDINQNVWIWLVPFRGRQLRLVFQDKGNSVARVFTGWDLKRKKVKKRFGSLSETEQEKIENKYHQMNPADFDDMMSEAEIASTTSIRLPGNIVEALKIVAKLEGEQKYQNMDYGASAAGGKDSIAIIGNAHQRSRSGLQVW